MEKALLNLDEAAVYIGVGKTTLSTKLLQPYGVIPRITIGKAVRVAKVELDRWITAQLSESE